MKLRYYGGDKTIHGTEYLDVEVHDGEVVAVWFRCQHLPFRVTHVDEVRSKEMLKCYVGSPAPAINGVEVVD